MGQWAELIALIARFIRQNGNNEITGTVLQSVLDAMVQAMGLHSTYAGQAIPTTDPGTPDGKVFYFASKAGNYPYFGGITVNTGEFVTLDNQGGGWTKTTLINFGNDDFAFGDLVSKSLSVQNDIIFGGILRTLNFLTGAAGAQITQDGRAEVESLVVRDYLEVPDHRRNVITLLANEFWFSDYGVIASVTPSGSDVQITFKADGSYAHSFKADDILRTVLDLPSGTQVGYYRVASVIDATQIIATPVNAVALQADMVIYRQGNYTDTNRQGSIYVDGRAGFLRFLVNVNTTDILPANIALELRRDGNITGITVGTDGIRDGAVTTPKLADEAATRPKIGAQAIDGSKLDPNIVLPAGGTVPTAEPGNLSGRVANTAFVQEAIASAIAAIPKPTIYTARIGADGAIISQSTPAWITAATWAQAAGLWRCRLTLAGGLTQAGLAINVTPFSTTGDGTDPKTAMFSISTTGDLNIWIYSNPANNPVQASFSITAIKIE